MSIEEAQVLPLVQIEQAAAFAGFEPDDFAVFEIAVVPAGAPDEATSMLKVTEALAPADSEPMFFERTLAATGSGLIVTPFSLALLPT